MSTLFISDLHLETSRPDITNLFFEFLQKQASKADALYILGDLFEAWVGDDDRASPNQEIIDNLKQLVESGVPTYIMHGNRDFLIGKKFIKDSACTLLEDPTVIDLYGTRTLLMHGDSMCTDDVAHMNFRSQSRNPIFQQFFLCKSLEERKQLAKQLRERSKEYMSTAEDHIMDVNQNSVDNEMKKHQVLQLIHGHTHRPAVHTFKLNGEDAKRYVLAAWHEQGNVLECTPAGEMKLRYFGALCPDIA